MSQNPATISGTFDSVWSLPGVQSPARGRSSKESLAASITKAASKQTYYTVRYLVDRERVEDAYRTYAYFRWVDDRLDTQSLSCNERLAFVERQQHIMNQCYQGERLRGLRREEAMLVDLIRSDEGPDSGLQAYIRHMMAVMAFDAERRGRLISQQELDAYTLNLATAVTEALHYFIGHGQYAPQDDTRYCAASGAHIIHMLRDSCEDVEAGYYNVPREFLEAHGIDIRDVDSEAYQQWVARRVQVAQVCFAAGKTYLKQVENWRCRIAGYAYMARFQDVIAAIKREGYQLRPSYDERKSLSGGLRMAGSMLSMLAAGSL